MSQTLAMPMRPSIVASVEVYAMVCPSCDQLGVRAPRGSPLRARMPQPLLRLAPMIAAGTVLDVSDEVRAGGVPDAARFTHQRLSLPVMSQGPVWLQFAPPSHEDAGQLFQNACALAAVIDVRGASD